MAAALLGVLVAGLAVIVVFLNPAFLRVLNRTATGVSGDFFPFVYTAYVVSCTIAFCVGALLFLADNNDLGKRILISIGVFGISYSLFAVLNLTGYLALQGINQAHIMLNGETEDE